MEFETGLSKLGRARVLQRLGKRTGPSAPDKGLFSDPARDIGSMPSTQTTMGEGKAPDRRFETKRKCAPSLFTKFTSNNPFEAAQLGRRSTAAFSDRV